MLTERYGFRPPSFPISRRCYVKVEKHFSLPHATLGAIVNSSHVYSRFLEYDDKQHTKLRRMGKLVPVLRRQRLILQGACSISLTSIK